MSIIVNHLIQIIVLVLGEGPTEDIDGSVDPAEQTFSTNFTEAKVNHWIRWHCNS